ncbi:uncharacterized protein BT62DRAFT_934592 [Guyanagaster necrorhizus]|uniref:Uncharacterized protein n=1 Tax=Guyanagaster necrorhizus TaxID=856835 RepID=A0A9P8AQM4_9AGAR|nr:uncharacterized protein BT62DRAFT_934592 [Guyanagaster necrorhizus MCA 3950]KAG7444006.1 hypothetical protein BT62DRAFT_934592 [Guyanagaster necrorhizus MCA 3950]
MLTAPQGLVLVLAENGPVIADDRFNDWYNNEHAPARLTVPGYMTAIRYQATDSKKPTHLTLYELSSPDVADGPEFQALKHKASDNEKDILLRVPFLSRRIYQTIGVFTHPASTSPFPGRYVLIAELEVKPELEEEFNKWFNEEHVGLLEKVPGRLRSRSYSLVRSMGRGEAVGKPVFKYLAIHEFDNGDYLKTPEWAAALDTPWRTKVMEGVLGMEVRQFELNKIMEKPL